MVVETIIKGERAWTTAGKLVKRYGMPAIKECERAGLIECWQYDRAGKRLRAPAWTLTDKGAHAYNVRVTEIPNEATGLGVPFWSDGFDLDGRPRRAVRLSTPRAMPEARASAKGAVVRGDDGEPLVLLGVHARVDPRLGRKAGKSAQRHR
jgi:hypothetical protein